MFAEINFDYAHVVQIFASSSCATKHHTVIFFI